MDYLLEAYPEAKTIAVIYPNIGYGGMVERFISLATERGLEVVHTQSSDLLRGGKVLCIGEIDRHARGDTSH